MKIEIRSHYWPNTPHLREIKLFIDKVEVQSSFMTKEEILQLSKELIKIGMDVGGFLVVGDWNHENT